MRRLAIMAACLVGACTSDRPPDVDGIDVVVSGSDVGAFVHFTSVDSQAPRFPAPGECTGESDDTAGIPSCLRYITVDSARLNTFTHAWSTEFDVPEQTTLQVDGCGESLEIPLDRSHAPHLSNVVATPAGSDVNVSWTPNDASAVFVEISDGINLQYCNDSTTAVHTIPHGTQYFEGGVGVRGLSPAEVTETPLGTIRVFYSDVTWIPLPLPAPAKR